MPDALLYNDFIMSFGLMEHFIDGPDIPLKAMYNALNEWVCRDFGAVPEFLHVV
ncbi:MAG: hypothetical protein J6T57_02080 [Alphaproteobacteria bacterium]|nr:hypothetical protein [Alphaproteobacteria bacterium]